LTIAAGIMSRGGVTIAADTKEGYGDTHTFVDKITTSVGVTGEGAIVSSGEAYILDYLTPFVQSLISEGLWATADEFEVQLKELMANLYKSDAVEAYPKDRASDIYTQFLVAVRPILGQEANLFIVNSTLVTRATQLGTVIGCGPLREFGEELGTVAAYHMQRAKVAALSIVHEAKRRYSDVGGTISMITLLNSGGWETENKSQQAEIETLLDSIRIVTSRVTLSALDSSITAGRFNSILSETGIQLRDVRRKACEIEKRYEQDRIVKQKQNTKRLKKMLFERKVKQSISRKPEPGQ
jgi:hypothetical protein